ncbi:MAG TPA: sugar ABC transporter ATP-binding protein [Geminicoccaceae bacterium]|nr:sugar ABC transporter ATP-binding protein [Geminicoccaceae bacterium]
MAFLEIRDLWRRFPGVDALQAVTLEAERGEVHALVGANGAGKSTLMNILAGVLPASSGEIRLGGAPFTPDSPRAAQARGIGVVYQELSLIPERSVADNVFLGREPAGRFGVVDRGRLAAQTRALLERYRLPLDPAAVIADLSVAQRQLVEIARALSIDAQVLILDEPTAVLSLHEQDNLFAIVARLKAAGLLVLYVSHRLDEIFRIADRVTVLRDGRKVRTLATASATQAELVRLMIGHDVRDRLPLPEVKGERPLLEVTWQGGHGRPSSSFALRRGEILGIAGFVGAGRTRLARAIIGASEPRVGDAVGVVIAGQGRRIRSPAEAIAHGILYVTEDRKREGLFANLTVLANATAAALPVVSQAGVLTARAERERAGAILADLRLVAHSLDVPVSELSGGNQQKVVLGRALLRAPKVLICDEPTRGVDVGAKDELYGILLRLAAAGVGIVVISSEVKELLMLSHRVLVMRDGAVVAEFETARTSEDQILLAATGASAGSPGPTLAGG